MPLTREQKQNIIKDLSERLTQVKLLALIDYSGLDMSGMSELRKILRGVGADLKVAKKTLVDLALIEIGLKDIKTKELNGQIGLVFSQQDEVEPAKALYQFGLKNKALKILGGILEQKLISQEQVIFLAKLTSREELLAKLVSSISAPLSGLASVLNGNLRNFVYLLSKIKV